MSRLTEKIERSFTPNHDRTENAWVVTVIGSILIYVGITTLLGIHVGDWAAIVMVCVGVGIPFLILFGWCVIYLIRNKGRL